MNFSKAAAIQQVLRGLTEKRAVAAPSVGGAVGGLGRAVSGIGKAVGKPLNWAWQRSMRHNGPVIGTVGLGLGILGAGALARRAVNQTRAAYHGFQPEVQAYTRQSPYQE